MKMSPSPITLTETDLALNSDGLPYSQAFGDVYHPAAGGLEQARHVFLGGNELPVRWRGCPHFTVLETGFGLGLNFLETWRILDEDVQAPARLHFVSVEKHPVRPSSMAKVHARWPMHSRRSEELLQRWPLPLSGFHRLQLGRGRVILTLLLGEAAEMLAQLVAGVDAFYLDGFAPARNPALWTPALCSQLARLARPGATLATWTVAAGVRASLAAAGFELEKQRGLGAKREMLKGRFSGAASPAGRPERKAVIIGAGLAGAACAERLAARDWQVEVIERRPGPAEEGSGNPASFLAPLLNLADAPNAQLSRAGFQFARRHLSELNQAGPQGGLRIARDLREAERFQRLLQEHAFPAAFARYVDAGEATALAGRAVSKPGMLFPTATAVEPAQLCAAQLASARIARRFDTAVASLQPQNGGWTLLDGCGQTLAHAQVVIVACALQSMALVPALRLESVRGQITLLPHDPGRRLKLTISGDGHAALLADGRLFIGATFQPLDGEPAIRAADHAANMARIEAMLPGLCAGARTEDIQGRVAFRTVTPDRLPVFGAVPWMAPGLYTATGLGARGLGWASLGAELLASQIAGEPWPLGKELAAAISPARFQA